MKYLLPLLVFILLSQSGSSCGNEFGYKLDGTRVHTRFFFISHRMTQFDTNAVNIKITKGLYEIRQGTDTYKTWSNLALNKMKLGQVDSAMAILRPLMVRFPDEYMIMANLGTAYELSGELDSALKYITQGYKKNKKSHLGSEWIHIKILKAKIKEKQDPGWLKLNRVISLYALEARIDTNNYKRSVRRINRAMMLQLRTRVPFTPAPNKIMCNLLHTLGDFNMKHGSYENALLAYAYALTFNPPHYRERPLEQSIRKLNKARGEMDPPPPLGFMFHRMLKRSLLGPTYLMMGVQEEAELFDAMHLVEVSLKDSVQVYKVLMDSIWNELIMLKEAAQEEPAAPENNDMMFLLLGLFVGAVLVFGFLRWKKIS